MLVPFLEYLVVPVIVEGGGANKEVILYFGEILQSDWSLERA